RYRRRPRNHGKTPHPANSLDPSPRHAIIHQSQLRILRVAAMPRLLTYPVGHHWETSDNGDAPTAAWPCVCLAAIRETEKEEEKRRRFFSFFLGRSTA